MLFVKHDVPISCCATYVLYNWISQCGPSLRTVLQGVLELLIGIGFSTFEPGELDLSPGDPELIGIHLLPSMDVCTKFVKVGQCVLKVLIGNKTVTDGRTDRPTCVKHYALSSSFSLICFMFPVQ